MKVTLDKGMNPRCLVLIRSGNEADTRDGRMAQANHAAYIDGYTTATGELNRFITRLWQTDKATASTVYHALEALRKQQDESYSVMIDRLNNKETWDKEEDEP